MPLPAIHPGEHLAEESEALEMSAAGLARLLNGQRSTIKALPTPKRREPLHA